MFKFIHGADFHLDSPFGALQAEKAAARRRESRQLAARMADYVRENSISLVLLAGDLFDSANAFRETGEQLAQALERMEVPVCIAPGNHDPFVPGGVWESVCWPDNVCIFRKNVMMSVELPQWNAVVHGAAFTGPEQGSSLLAGFHAPADGRVHLGLLHGEAEAAEDRYDPLGGEEIAASGLAYLALGHIHKRGQKQYGPTLCAWPGCPEGRGFDELGEKGFYEGIVSDSGAVSLTFVPFARHRYEVVTVDVTGKSPLAAVEEALPKQGTEGDLYRVVLTGETGEGGGDAGAIRTALAERFYALEVRDNTRLAEDVWRRAEEDSLRGLFLRSLRQKLDSAADEAERESIARAARFGLAALDHRDLG